MGRADVNGEPALAVAFALFAFAGVLEMVLIWHSGAFCHGVGGLVLAPVVLVPLLWLGGVVSLHLATRDRTLRGDRLVASGGVVAAYVGIAFLPALGSTVMVCVP